jgi:hypothetical protein
MTRKHKPIGLAACGCKSELIGGLYQEVRKVSRTVDTWEAEMLVTHTGQKTRQGEIGNIDRRVFAQNSQMISEVLHMVESELRRYYFPPDTAGAEWFEPRRLSIALTITRKWATLYGKK